MDDSSDKESVSSKLVIDIDCEITEMSQSITSAMLTKRRSALLSSFKSKGSINNNAELFFNSSIRIGNEYQASILQPINHQSSKIYYDSRIQRETSLWKPNDLKQNEIKLYLKKYGIKCGYQISKPADDEDALYLLMKNNYNIEKSLVQLAMNSHSARISKEPKKLSVPECKEFERSFSKHNKRFRCYLESGDILKNRKLWELIFFYYVWKKSYRYPLFILRKNHCYKELPVDMIDHMKFLIQEDFLIDNKLIKK